MFSLIIAIISIALVAALALATIYYGGDAFNKGSAGAKAAQLINEGQQIAGAITLADVDAAAGDSTAAAFTEVADVAPTYLSQLPTNWKADQLLSEGILVAENVPTKVCDAVNERATGGVTRLADVDAAKTSATVYGCVGAADAAGTVFYRLK